MSFAPAFSPAFAAALPETHALLQAANLRLHPRVSRVTLHGSRGLAQRAHAGSDFDLSLLVNVDMPPQITSALDEELQEVLHITVDSWQGPVEPDLAVIFPLQRCGLRCFTVNAYDPELCTQGGTDCFGIYKIQKGFQGFVLNTGIRVKKMYPCITVWRRPEPAVPTGKPGD